MFEGIPPGKSSDLPLKKYKRNQNKRKKNNWNQNKWNPNRWNQNRYLLLLQVYARYKTELPCPSIEKNLEVWREIAVNFHKSSYLLRRFRGGKRCPFFSELECMNTIELLRFQYQANKTVNMPSRQMAKFISIARSAFETPENPATTFAELSGVSLPRLNWPWRKCFPLLRLYTKCKTGLSSPNINEQSVWMKIAEEIGKNSPQYDAKECRNQFRWMKCEYEKMKHKEPYKLRESQAVFLDEAEIAFENIEIPDFYYLQSELEKYGMSKSDRITLLQVYAKYKEELLLQNFDVEQQIVWGKVAREVSEKCSSFYGKRRCCCVINNLKHLYEISKEAKEKNKRKGKIYEEPYFFQEARKTFDCTEC